MASIESKVANLSLGDKEGKPLADATVDRSNALADKWDDIKKTKYNYNLYNAKTREEREAAEAELKKDDDQLAGQEGEDEHGMYTAEVPVWASNAAKYEWDDEYGDVGPAHPVLEKQLFRDRYIARAGQKLDT